MGPPAALDGASGNERYFVLSPKALYPQPYARLINQSGETLHVWTHAAEQPQIEDLPPSLLCGWNHVELDRDGSLYAIVPLHCLLKLDANSNLVWKSCVSAH